MACDNGVTPVLSGVVALGSYLLPYGILQRELAVVHRANSLTAMYHAMLNVSVSTIVFLLVGYALSNGFIEGREQQEFVGERFFVFLTLNDCAFMDVLSELARVLAVTAIVTGAATERIHTHAIGAAAIFIPGLIFSIPRYWTAGDNSWLLIGSANMQVCECVRASVRVCE